MRGGAPQAPRSAQMAEATTDYLSPDVAAKDALTHRGRARFGFTLLARGTVQSPQNSYRARPIVPQN